MSPWLQPFRHSQTMADVMSQLAQTIEKPESHKIGLVADQGARQGDPSSPYHARSRVTSSQKNCLFLSVSRSWATTSREV